MALTPSPPPSCSTHAAGAAIGEEELFQEDEVWAAADEIPNGQGAQQARGVGFCARGSRNPGRAAHFGAP